LEQAHEAGITAVPTYVIDRRWAIPGAQDPEVFVQALRRFADKTRQEREGQPVQEEHTVRDRA
jgi:predicted DsbA family dithiol-disulfide isomerase